MRVWLRAQQQPAELFQEYTTIEYSLPTPAKQIQPPAYVFVVDTCVAEDELRAAVASLSQALTTLPEYAQVRRVEKRVALGVWSSWRRLPCCPAADITILQQAHASHHARRSP